MSTVASLADNKIVPLIDRYKIIKYSTYNRDQLLQVLPPAVVTLYPHISREQALSFLIWGIDPQPPTQDEKEMSGLMKIERLTKYNLLSAPTRELIDILYGDGVTFALSPPDRLTALLINYDQDLQFADNADDTANNLGITLGCPVNDAQVALYAILKNYLTAQRDKSAIITISQVVAMDAQTFADLAPDISYKSRTDYVAQKYYNLF